MARGNHFDVLGVHWSASPAALKDAHEKLLKEYGAGGKWAALNPGVCRDMVQKVEAAYTQLKDEARRVAYRRTAYPDVDPELLDGLLESQMKALEWRGATEEAQDARQIRHELRASVNVRPPNARPPTERS
jgi:DnaJ-class molecular chaperone